MHVMSQIPGISKTPISTRERLRDRGEREICIIDIALPPEFRTQGIGTSILGDLIEDSRATGKPLSIHVEQFNPAMRLYERLGFRAIGEVGIYYKMERPVEV